MVTLTAESCFHLHKILDSVLILMPNILHKKRARNFRALFLYLSYIIIQ